MQILSGVQEMREQYWNHRSIDNVKVPEMCKNNIKIALGFKEYPKHSIIVWTANRKQARKESLRVPIPTPAGSDPEVPEFSVGVRVPLAGEPIPETYKLAHPEYVDHYPRISISDPAKLVQHPAVVEAERKAQYLAYIEAEKQKVEEDRLKAEARKAKKNAPATRASTRIPRAPVQFQEPIERTPRVRRATAKALSETAQAEEENGPVAGPSKKRKVSIMASIEISEDDEDTGLSMPEPRRAARASRMQTASADAPLDSEDDVSNKHSVKRPSAFGPPLAGLSTAGASSRKRKASVEDWDGPIDLFATSRRSMADFPSGPSTAGGSMSVGSAVGPSRKRKAVATALDAIAEEDDDDDQVSGFDRVNDRITPPDTIRVNVPKWYKPANIPVVKPNHLSQPQRAMRTTRATSRAASVVKEDDERIAPPPAKRAKLSRTDSEAKSVDYGNSNENTTSQGTKRARSTRAASRANSTIGNVDDDDNLAAPPAKRTRRGASSMISAPAASATKASASGHGPSTRGQKTKAASNVEKITRGPGLEGIPSLPPMIKGQKPKSRIVSKCVNCNHVSSMAHRNLDGPERNNCESCFKRRDKKY